MFSVIIPTMWKSDYIWTLFERLDVHPLVGEIILIDNSTENREILNVHKLKHIREGKNTYVNPAWNKGVALAKWENICIANDDLAFNPDLLEWVLPHTQRGIIGQATSNYYKSNTTFGPSLHKMDIRQSGWGCLLFIHKSNWINIPDDLLIACGDDYLLKYVVGGGWMIVDNPLEYDRMSITSYTPELLPIQSNDLQTFKLKY